jgi:hypothetical protein
MRILEALLFHPVFITSVQAVPPSFCILRMSKHACRAYREPGSPRTPGTSRERGDSPAKAFVRPMPLVCVLALLLCVGGSAAAVGGKGMRPASLRVGVSVRCFVLTKR